MSTNVLRGAAIVLLIAAVIVAAIAFFMPGGASSPTLGERHGAPSDQPANNVDVVVAAHDLAPFVSLTADDLDRVQMPPPDRAYFSDIDDLIGRISAVDLVRVGSKAVGGKGGGGRPDMAQAGGPEGSRGAAALKAIEVALEEVG